MIYIYAITGRSVAPPALVRGHGGEPLAVVEADGLEGIYSHHADGATFSPTPDALWVHEAVVDALLRGGSVLPLRFGTTLANVAALHALLRDERERFVGLLERVRGCVELAVRVGLPEDVGEALDGQAYLEAKLAARRSADAILRPLESLASAAHWGPAGSAPVVTASYLVARDYVPRFADAVRGLQSRHPELTLSCTGPWAPYSFMREDAA